MTVRGIVVLGSTGSIGRSTLDVVARHPDRFRAVALSARRDVDTLYEQCVAHRPDCVAMLEPEAAQSLRERLNAAGVRCEVLSGPEGMRTVAAIEGADSVMAAIVGAAGLEPTLAAVRAGRRVRWNGTVRSFCPSTASTTPSSSVCRGTSRADSPTAASVASCSPPRGGRSVRSRWSGCRP